MTTRQKLRLQLHLHQHTKFELVASFIYLEDMIGVKI